MKVAKYELTYWNAGETGSDKQRSEVYGVEQYARERAAELNAKGAHCIRLVLHTPIDLGF